MQQASSIASSISRSACKVNLLSQHVVRVGPTFIKLLYTGTARPRALCLGVYRVLGMLFDAGHGAAAFGGGCA